MHVTAQLAGLLDLKGAKEASELEKRIRYGAAPPELMDLLDIRSVGRVRARKLYEAGFKSTAELAAASPEHIAVLVGPKITERIFKQIGRREAVSEFSDIEPLEKGSSDGQRTISDY